MAVVFVVANSQLGRRQNVDIESESSHLGFRDLKMATELPSKLTTRLKPASHPVLVCGGDHCGLLAVAVVSSL